MAPLWLLGLGALAIPVLIHLVQRERKHTVAFPSLMFVRKIPYKSVRRRRIHHWWLLLVRAVAIALIIMAFARPFLRHPVLALEAGGGAREVVILLDRSYSMGFGDRWDKARAAARDAIGTLGQQDRASLVLFGRGADLVVRSTGEGGTLRAGVETAHLSAEVTRYPPALKLAQTILKESQAPRREVVLISDFQKAGWERTDDLRLPDGVKLTPVRIGDGATSNAAVTGVSVQRAPFAGRERATITAAIANQSDKDRDLDAALEIDGHEAQKQRVSIRAGTSAAVTFAPMTLERAQTPGTVRLPADALARDDVFHFTLSPGEPVRVWVFGSDGASRQANLYLTRALAIGTTPSFDVQTASAGALTSFDLEAARARAASHDSGALILADVALPRGAAGDRLKRFVENGGGVLVLAGGGGRFEIEESPLLPGKIGAPIDRLTSGGATLGIVDYSHPVFELFKSPRSGDFSGARFFRYHALTALADAQVLARFDDGTPALVERKIGSGRVLLWTSTFDNDWNDLPLKPVFLPFVHRVVSHLAGYRAPTAWMTVGQVLEVPSGDRRLVRPAGEQTTFPPAERSRVVELGEQGFYEIRDRTGHDAGPQVVAVNVDVSESDLAPLDLEELIAAITGTARSDRVAAQKAAERLTPQEQERRQALWRHLLLIGLALLAVDTIVSNRLSRPVAAGRVEIPAA
ncbi:MAG: BatA domain-containing protein [Acidobacteria bacterium]|nr:BatA domain-containing protein [Acidobacteriota bacterium]